MEALSQRRSLLRSVNITMETEEAMLDDNATDSWHPKHNTAVAVPGTVNASSGWRGGNLTDLTGEEGGDVIVPRIVGGFLEKRGGSPWQVWMSLVFSWQLFSSCFLGCCLLPAG